MENLDKEQAAIKEYLLGGLDEESRERFETRYMTDPEFKEAVLLVEDELLEDYAFGTLPPREGESFAARLASDPRQARKLRLTNRLKDYAGAKMDAGAAVEAGDVRRAPFWRRWFMGPHGTLKLAFTVGLLLLLGLLLIPRVLERGRRQNPREAAERELARLNAPGGAEGVLSSGAKLYTLALSPVSTRDTRNAPTVVVAGDEGVVRLRMTLLRAEWESYRAGVQGVSGSELFAVEGLRPGTSEGGSTLDLYVPAGFLPPGDYFLKLSGRRGGGGRAEDAGEFYFRVARR